MHEHDCDAEQRHHPKESIMRNEFLEVVRGGTTEAAMCQEQDLVVNRKNYVPLLAASEVMRTMKKKKKPLKFPRNMFDVVCLVKVVCSCHCLCCSVLDQQKVT